MTKALRLPFLIGLALRTLLPWYAHGFRYMDEHWQVMEPANHLLHDAWSITTEWHDGLRSWIYPWLVSLPMRLAELLGIQDPLWITSFVRMIHGALAAAAIPLVYYSVDKLLAHRSKVPAIIAAWVVALWPFAIYCGFHTHGEMAGALFVLAGVAAPILIKNERTAYVLSGLAFGVALVLKIDVAVAGLAFGVWQVLDGKLRRAFYLVAGVLPLVVLVGYVDYVTWGSWFHSVTGHARVNLIDGVGNQWGVSPWYTHIIYFFDLTGAPALAAALALPFCWKTLPKNLRAVWFVNLFFVAVFCAIPHKEKRFLAPLIYTGPLAAFATLAFVMSLARTRVPTRKLKWALLTIATLLVVHGAANTVTYLVRRPWWNRIEAIHNANKIPGARKMFSPQWPAIYYLARQIPSESINADRETIRKKTMGLRDISVATDWLDLSPFTDLGFKCEQWPKGTPVSEQQPVPRALHCIR